MPEKIKCPACGGPLKPLRAANAKLLDVIQFCTWEQTGHDKSRVFMAKRVLELINRKN